MRTTRSAPATFVQALPWLAALAACLASAACASDLDLSLAGRPCLNGACVRGYECIDAVCVAASGTFDDAIASADAGQLMLNKDSSAPFFPGAWIGAGGGGGGEPALDASVVPPDPPDAAVSGGAGGAPASGGAGGAPESGGTGGVEAGGSGGAPVEPPPPTCASDARCDNSCVDLLTDPAHCGRCGNACASVERCVDGACAAECEADDPDISIGVDLDADDDDEECPETCDSCTGNTCEIHCDTEQGCKERSINCPGGYACVLSCSAPQACEKLTLTCADDALCSIRCAGEQACKEVTIDCAGSHCEMLCVEGKDACDKAQLACGPGACGATCGASTKKPMVTRCEQSCSTPTCACE